MKELLKDAERIARELKTIEDGMSKRIGSCHVYIDFHSPADLPQVRIHEAGRGLARITFDEARGLFSWLKELGIVEEKP